MTFGAGDSTSVRETLVETLRLDLVGPDNSHAFARELLPEVPTRWYLTGFLVPTDAPIAQRFDETSTEKIEQGGDTDRADDAVDPDKPAARRSFLPSSIGLSVLVSADTDELDVRVSWGDYLYEGRQEGDEPADGQVEGGEAGPEAEDPEPPDGEGVPAKPSDANVLGWRRQPREERIQLRLPDTETKKARFDIPDGEGLVVVTTVRQATAVGVPSGTKVVSVFLVNEREPDPEHAYRSFIFQAHLELACARGFVPRADPRGSQLDDEWDRRVADLQYRDSYEFAVGHGVSVEAEFTNGLCPRVATTWLPSAEVERVAPAEIADVELNMESLGALFSASEAELKLTPLVNHYRAWIAAQRSVLSTLNPERKQTAQDMLSGAEVVANRIEAGISLLRDADVLEAFCIANRAVARAARQRFGTIQGKEPSALSPPTWRPFQLAYILMTIRSIAEPRHEDRRMVDLLFFPTGGGKTEAYLGLAAFTLVLRRLRSRGPDGTPDIRSAGVSVLMRYTLRLLTLDQLGRAAGLMCALELEREQNKTLLGAWPFEIGLWVGQAATPNTMGHRGDRSPRRPYTAYTKTEQFQKNSRKPSPIPLEECPWCGEKFHPHSFRLVPNRNRPIDLRVHCANHKCDFHGDRHLPIVAVDEPIYRRLPGFLVATVDKFAALPWTGDTGALFGKVDRHDQNGFYGPCAPGQGVPIPGGQLPPPDLIIQDELHLISGPLGTVAGVYETVIDSLCARMDEEHEIRPKVIASTATVRRADSQIRALFGRSRVNVFPPPGPDRRDSFFARTLQSTQSPARLYVGIAAQGRSLKVVLLRTALALLSAAQRAWSHAETQGIKPNPSDPYMTLLGYFNSLRELGGSRRIVEDEVRTRLAQYSRRKRRGVVDDLFADREISYEVLELTSRVSTNDVAAAKRRLALSFGERERVDVALATNMISVGLDIVRLGLMVVLGQPKTSSEYIQSTSRVGRDEEKPGLVVTLLNVHKPRDRSHYERFSAYHESFYRSVEATSVTPFSPRALDCALAAALVALCRHEIPVLTPPLGAERIQSERARLDCLAERIAIRARDHRGDMSETEKQALYAQVLHRAKELLDDWLNIATRAGQEGSAIQYQREANKPPRRLLYEFLDPELANLHPVHMRFRANRSMRDVEPSVDISVTNLNDWGNTS